MIASLQGCLKVAIGYGTVRAADNPPGAAQLPREASAADVAAGTEPASTEADSTS